MDALARSKSNVNLRRIDIVSWQSAVSREFGIRRLPTVWLYDGTSKVSSSPTDIFRRISQLH